MVRRAFIALLALAAVACAGVARQEGVPRAALAPGPVLRGAELSPPLFNPVAVAAHSGELYILDAALGLARVDTHARRTFPVVRRAFAPGARLAAAADGTVYVLEPPLRRVSQFGRDGRPLAGYVVDATVGSLTDLVLDAPRGRVLAVDGLQRQLVAFHPLGRAFELLPLRPASAPVAIALGADALYASDPRCACLARIAADGRVLGTFGHGFVRQPGRLAADRYGRILVLDHGDRRLKVFRGERLAEEIEFARLGVTEVSDLALADDWLYVADAPGGQLRLFRVQPP